MHGKNPVRFSDLFIDTVRKHGLYWAWLHYVRRNHMEEWEFTFWTKATNVTEFYGV